MDWTAAVLLTMKVENRGMHLASWMRLATRPSSDVASWTHRMMSAQSRGSRTDVTLLLRRKMKASNLNLHVRYFSPCNGDSSWASRDNDV